MKNTFNISDLVRLKSGSYTMTVVSANDMAVTVTYFVAPDIYTHSLPPEALVLNTEK